MAKDTDPNMTAILQLMMEMKAEDRRAEQRREDREEERRRETERKDQLRREEDHKREETFLIALKAAQPAVPQIVTILNHKLPDMKDNEDIDMFVAMFEAALRANNIPEEQWKAKLHSHLSPKAKLKIQTTIQDVDATCEQIKEALLGCSNMTFSAAAETLMTADKGKLTYLTSDSAITSCLD